MWETCILSSMILSPVVTDLWQILLAPVICRIGKPIPAFGTSSVCASSPRMQPRATQVLQSKISAYFENLLTEFHLEKNRVVGCCKIYLKKASFQYIYLFKNRSKILCAYIKNYLYHPNHQTIQKYFPTYFYSLLAFLCLIF